MKSDVNTYLYLILTLSLLSAAPKSQCLKMVQVRVPAYKLKGESAVLECVYELEGFEKLYTVKWYKENKEFYRFVPRYKPSQISYRVEGIKIDVSTDEVELVEFTDKHQQSNDTRVTLKTVSLKTSAMYRCEVSAEAPSFSSAQGSGRLEVVVLPTNGPHITGERNSYVVGDVTHLTCASGKSYIPALQAAVARQRPGGASRASSALPSPDPPPRPGDDLPRFPPARRPPSLPGRPHEAAVCRRRLPRPLAERHGECRGNATHGQPGGDASGSQLFHGLSHVSGGSCNLGTASTPRDRSRLQNNSVNNVK